MATKIFRSNLDPFPAEFVISWTNGSGYKIYVSFPRIQIIKKYLKIIFKDSEHWKKLEQKSKTKRNFLQANFGNIRKQTKLSFFLSFKSFKKSF